MLAAAPRPTEPRLLDEAVRRVRDAAPDWARATLAERLEVARGMLEGVLRVAPRLVAAACEAKGADPDSPAGGELALSGPWVTARILRQTIRSLESLLRNGSTPVGPLGETADGRLSVRVAPAGLVDAVLFPLVRAEVHLEEGVDEAALHESRARFHRAPDHDGRVCLVLGAGNIDAIPPTDCALKLFNEGKACVLKVNPVNAYLGPLLEDAFQDAVGRGLLAVVQGGAEEGAYLARHPGVDEIHVTGSEETHDRIVWGPPGPERERRKASGERVNAKEITSELGSVSPVLVVPGPWDGFTLRFQAETVAAGVTFNSAFNCNAARILLLPRGWRHRDAFLAALQHHLALAPARRAWYPGAAERWRALVEGRREVFRTGGSRDGDGTLPWTIVTGLDPDSDDPAFRRESFCSVLAVVELGSADPEEYLATAVAFANERLWGTLSAYLLAHPRTLGDARLGPAVDRAVRALRYGAVSVNTWGAYAFGLGTTPWGAFPGAPLSDIQSGRGFVHNTLMLERIEKTVVRHPAWTFPKPVYFPSHRTSPVVARRLLRLESGRISALPGVVAAAARG
jgi:aldehyde dehydrogenase (NAD(P)+)